MRTSPFKSQLRVYIVPVANWLNIDKLNDEIVENQYLKLNIMPTGRKITSGRGARSKGEICVQEHKTDLGINSYQI